MINANKVFSMTADTRVSVRVKVGLWLGLQRSHWGGGFLYIIRKRKVQSL